MVTSWEIIYENDERSEIVHFIYCLTNKVNSKKYIGRTNDIKRRMSQHKVDSFNRNCPNKYDTPLAAAIRKYGWENFTVEVLEQHPDLQVINQKEISWIKKLNTYLGEGYNASSGGELGFTGRIYSSKFAGNLPEIIRDIKNNVNFKTIAKKYDISISYVSDINNGTRLKQDNEKYPLRSNLVPPYSKIVDDLIYSSDSMSRIAKRYGISESTVQRINSGTIRAVRQLYSSFPIRNHK